MTFDQGKATATRRTLGRRLAELRGAAALTQAELAERIAFSRSTVGNVEAGHQSAGAVFWQACDEVLVTGGVLQRAADESLRSASSSPSTDGGSDTAVWQRDRAIADALAVLDGCPGPARSGVLHDRIVAAHRRHDRTGEVRPSLILVGGHAGSGKTEFARFLSCLTGWAVLDKDTTTRALVEELLASFGHDPDDRHTSYYREYVRPLEYRCLLDAALDNVCAGVSVVVTAPFAAEFSDVEWFERVRNRALTRSAHVHAVWLRCDPPSMWEYVTRRGAARDRWKVQHWAEYLAGIDQEFAPPFEHHVVDNRLNAAIGLADQARDLAVRVLR